VVDTRTIFRTDVCYRGVVSLAQFAGNTSE
jgi:hypothetical protein